MSDFSTVEQSMQNYLYNTVVNVPDFPVAGVNFKDVMPLLQDPQALKYTVHLLARPYQNQVIDKVISIESRGFLLGPSLAQALNAGFSAVRKVGKLPRETVATNYQLEYDSSTIEIHTDAIQSGERVLIHDDLLATGGSVAAATSLVDQLDGQVCGYSFIIELLELSGRQKLNQNIPVESILRL